MGLVMLPLDKSCFFQAFPLHDCRLLSLISTFSSSIHSSGPTFGPTRKVFPNHPRLTDILFSKGVQHLKIHIT